MTINWINHRCGVVRVVKMTDKRINGNIVWECVCDCGRTVELHSNQLHDGGPKYCRCHLKELRYGDKIGELTFIEYLRPCRYDRYCRVKCFCGTIFKIRLFMLGPKGYNRSCGCSDLHSGKIYDKTAWWWNVKSMNNRVNDYRQMIRDGMTLKQIGLQVGLTQERVRQIINKRI